jgi:hypothetical protein
VKVQALLIMVLCVFLKFLPVLFVPLPQVLRSREKHVYGRKTRRGRKRQEGCLPSVREARY